MNFMEKLFRIKKSNEEVNYWKTLFDYRANGFTREALDHKGINLGLEKSEKMGWGKDEAFWDDIREGAEEYFSKVHEILDEEVYYFTPEQVSLLEMNNIKVNPRSILTNNVDVI